MSEILDRIDNVKDINDLSIKELNELAKEIRHKILDVVSVNGGHLASNLGVVEMTIAMHKAFNSPKDKIIFDVGHQCYTHKLLTSRKDVFHTIRQKDGISGFPKRTESEHDCFETGHSSTSISAAIGMARARDLKNEDHHVVALIGDGALTGGMVWEALNDAGHAKQKIIIILNDNEMSISKNVGAVSRYLSNLRSQKGYIHLKGVVSKSMDAIPFIGVPMRRFFEKMKNAVKYLAVPNIVFEQMGFKYFGIIDGHDIEEMVTIMERAKDIKYPVIIHTRTFKGKGCCFAAERPESYHSTVPFDKETGKKRSNGKDKVSRRITSLLIDEAYKDDSICAITAAMEEGCGLDLFKKRFPKRFVDVGIAEQHAVTMAAGMAASGLKPIFSVYSTFLQRSYDQLVHDVCLPNLPVVFLVYNSGIVGQDGETHQGVFDFAYLRHIPNLIVMMPSNTDEAKLMIQHGLLHNGPTAICVPSTMPMIGMKHKGESDPIKWVQYTKAKSKKIAVLTQGKMLFHTVDAVGQSGIMDEVDVFNARSIKPMDGETLMHIASTYEHIVTVEDNLLQAGFGSAVLEWFEENQVPVPKFKRLGFGDLFVPHGTKEQIYEKYKLDAAGIGRQLMDILDE